MTPFIYIFFQLQGNIFAKNNVFLVCLYDLWPDSNSFRAKNSQFKNIKAVNKSITHFIDMMMKFQYFKLLAILAVLINTELVKMLYYLNAQS